MNFSAISRNTALGRLLRLPLRLLPAGTQVRILQGPLRGKRWIVGSGTHGCWLGTYELEKAQLFHELVGALPALDKTVFDVGAHAGYYTLLASDAVGPTGTVVAFEPLPRNLDFLRRHIQLNAARNVRVVATAVSDRPGTSGFRETDSSFTGSMSSHGNLTVRTISLDELTRRPDVPVPDVIKIDVEGAESLVLSGASQLLSTRAPLIFLAIHDNAQSLKCQQLLAAAGYTVHPLDPSDSGPLSGEIVAYRGEAPGSLAGS